MLTKAQAAEMDACPVALPQFAFECIAVRTGNRDTVVLERGLSVADIVAAFISGHMVADLGDKPWRIPADIPTAFTDQFFKIFAIQAPRQSAGGILLVGVAFALMPKHRPEAPLTG